MNESIFPKRATAKICRNQPESFYLFKRVNSGNARHLETGHSNGNYRFTKGLISPYFQGELQRRLVGNSWRVLTRSRESIRAKSAIWILAILMGITDSLRGEWVHIPGRATEKICGEQPESFGPFKWVNSRKDRHLETGHSNRNYRFTKGWMSRYFQGELQQRLVGNSRRISTRSRESIRGNRPFGNWPL